MNRRTWVMAGSALAAGAAGLGGALWRQRASDEASADARIWSRSFEKPGGGELRLATLRGKPVLLNFWATWCAPCITELPLLERFHQEHAAAGWQVIGLAVDNLQPVQEFLLRRPVNFAIGLAGFEGVDLSRTLGNTAGALPFSIVFDAHGDVRERKLGTITPDDLLRWVASAG